MIAIRLPPALAAIAGCEDVEVREDEDTGIVDICPAGESDRLRCFTLDQEASIVDEWRRVRRQRVTDDAQTIRDADARHAARSWGRGITMSRNPVGTRHYMRSR